jgi:flavodoxin
MQAVVVYESHWGNTETVARAIVDGYGQGARALTTDEATPAVIVEAELIVAGAPVMAFSLPSENMITNLSTEHGDGPAPNLLNTPMRTWLDGLPKGRGLYATFETKIRWSPGGATGAIGRALEAAGYRRLHEAGHFVVKGKYGPLRDGELEKARAWGAELATAAREAMTPAAG